LEDRYVASAASLSLDVVWLTARYNGARFSSFINIWMENPEPVQCIEETEIFIRE